MRLVLEQQQLRSWTVTPHLWGSENTNRKQKRKIMFVLPGITIYSKCKKYPTESVELNTSTVKVIGWSLHLPFQQSVAVPFPLRLIDRVSERAPTEQARAAPRQGWVWQITQLASPGSQKANTSRSQPAPPNLACREALGSRSALFTSGEL